MKEITVDELKQKLDANEDLFLLDIRIPAELKFGIIKDSVNIPMNELNKRADELPKDKEIIVICRSGARSSHVTKALVNAGYDAVNLKGGIREWKKFDDSIREY